MQYKKFVLSKITDVPLALWFLTMFIYILPFQFDHPGEGLRHQIWLIYIFPAFILSFYWGIWGGIIVAFLSIVIQVISGFPPPGAGMPFPTLPSWGSSHLPLKFGESPEPRFMIITTTTLLSFGLAICIGILADRLKGIQRMVEKKNGELEEKNKLLYNMLHIDELTGLWNRRGLLKVADKWVTGTPKLHFSVLFIDLDKFKPVNDTYGHHIGDTLLRDVAMRLKSCVAEGDVISRIGGDEFIILLLEASKDYSIQMARKINHELSNVFLIEEKEIFISSSIGISLSSENENDVESLLQSADIAMYFVKRKSKNDFSVFAPLMKDLSETSVQMENQIRKAITKEQFSLYYQPQLDVQSGQIVSFEALIRWNLDGKIISPAEFIPLAEETGLMLPIGQWVLETACKQIKVWEEAGYFPFPISVNVSSLQFQHCDFVQNLQKVLKKTQIEPELLRLELTESVLLNHGKDIIDKLTELKQLGVSLSIDDFGSGYSSLTYLKNFPMNEIKMDKSFISEVPFSLKDMSLVRSIINLVHSMNARVVAEGVETAEQFAFLKEEGCDIIQGYLIGRPLPVLEVEKEFKEVFKIREA